MLQVKRERIAAEEKAQVEEVEQREMQAEAEAQTEAAKAEAAKWRLAMQQKVDDMFANTRERAQFEACTIVENEIAERIADQADQVEVMKAVAEADERQDLALALALALA